jgi:lysozyme family protein
MPALTETLRSEYQSLFDTCVIKASRYNAVDACVKAISNGKEVYQKSAAATGVPWYFTGVIHKMECDCNFKTHLHNGDPLNARTTRVPKGRPRNGNPPFTFFDSAVDALTIEGFTQWNDWSISGMLYCLEKYNGFGYRSRGINTPYLWSFSNQYSKGKFVDDGKYDPNAISQQIGAAVMLRRMSELGIAIAGEKDLITRIKELGAQVHFDPGNYNIDAERLQKLLNSAGQHLRVDGKAGRHTSDAWQRISGSYLAGDPIH